MMPISALMNRFNQKGIDPLSARYGD
jgi:hypothetical protein